MSSIRDLAEENAFRLIAEIEKWEIPQKDIEDDSKITRQIYGVEFTDDEFRKGQIPVSEHYKSDAFGIAAAMLIEQIHKRGHAEIIKKVVDFATQAMVDISEGKKPI